MPGTASVQWRIDDGYLTAVVEIPTGTTARIELPVLEAGRGSPLARLLMY
ncbi:alpha-L-rhamnosidase C-terminal domain-containing protein [Arthrobacter sp. YN]|nr:alpha-L-rhamnosidase C-terminal domain-containing protein [Arthrobacter sp. YN]